jgi:hypothetical protein
MSTAGIVGSAVVLAVLSAIGAVVVIRELVALILPLMIWVDKF